MKAGEMSVQETLLTEFKDLAQQHLTLLEAYANVELNPQRARWLDAAAAQLRLVIGALAAAGRV
jgi:hypothetical protein